MSKAKKQITDLRNYDKWIEGYHPFKNWIINELECIRTGKPTTSEEEWPAIAHKLYTSLLKGAAALQCVGDREFYYKDNEIEILIRFKTDLENTSIKKRVYKLHQKVINVLEREQPQLEVIAKNIVKKK